MADQVGATRREALAAAAAAGSVVAAADRSRPPRPAAHAPDFDDIVEEWERHSFPASDPPANW